MARTNAQECLFCKIGRGEIPAEKLYESERVCAFRDLQPQAPTHFLIIPKRHIETLNELRNGDAELVGELYLAAKQLAGEAGIAEGGYRTVMNCNEDAGQSVWHIHLHLLGGRKLAWPPG